MSFGWKNDGKGCRHVSILTFNSKTSIRKKTLFYLCLMSVCFIGMAGCSGDDDGTKGDGLVKVKNVYTTGCKTDGVPRASNGANNAYAFGGLEEYIEYKSKADGYVYVTHANALFNCCSEEIKVDVQVKGNDIVVTETETDNSCNCICPFDVSYELGKLEPGQYNVTIRVYGRDRISFPSHIRLTAKW